MYIGTTYGILKTIRTNMYIDTVDTIGKIHESKLIFELKILMGFLFFRWCLFFNIYFWIPTNKYFAADRYLGTSYFSSLEIIL